MTRLAIGPANSASQAALWASAARSAGHDTVSLAFRPRPRLPGQKRRPSDSFTTAPDRRLPFPKVTSGSGRSRRARRLAQEFSHFALDGFAPLVGPIRHGLTATEVTQLSQWGTRLALIAHGSDVRSPERHARQNPDSYFPFLEPSFRAWLVKRSAANRHLALTAGVPVFVSTPDLLLDLPWATWLPVCVDAREWRAPRTTYSARPRILHTPTSAMKGSDVIDPVLRRLEERRFIDYVRPSGVPHAQMPALMASVDVVVDQIRSGSYGVTSVEAMLSGAVVVGHLTTEVRELLPEEPGIIDAPPQDFDASVEALLDNREHWAEVVDASTAYAEKWHDGTASARVLGSWLTAS